MHVQIVNQGCINPFPNSVPICHRSAKLSILILEGIIKKISYERRDYESVDKEPILGDVPKNDEKKNSGGKGLSKVVMGSYIPLSCLSVASKLQQTKVFKLFQLLKLSFFFFFSDYQDFSSEIFNLSNFVANFFKVNKS